MPHLPDEFLNEMREMLGDEYPAFLRAMDEPPALALRLNPLRDGAEAAAAAFIDGAVPWEPLGRYLKAVARPGAAVAHWAGAYYVQEASAMAAAAALDAQPGEAVLDLCAAPGGKSTRIAAALNHTGALAANDPELSRAKALAGNLERMGFGDALVVSAPPEKLADRWPGAFDAVLTDAPCSGEGMFRRAPAARDEWRPNAPAACAVRQAAILDCAAAMVRPGGRLVYSTCTFNRAENEGSVAAFLQRHPDFAPEDFALPGVGASRDGMLRLLPHRLRGDGHFVARLRRDGNPSPRRPAAVHDDPAARALLRRLRDEVCDIPQWLEAMPLSLAGDCLVAAPRQAPDLQGLRALSAGLPLLRAGRSHIQPEHPLAMALSPALARRAAPLSDADAARYLAGQPLPADTPDGWTLVTCQGMPLGWAKAVGGTLKNRLPKGLRRFI